MILTQRLTCFALIHYSYTNSWRAYVWHVGGVVGWGDLEVVVWRVRDCSARCEGGGRLVAGRLDLAGAERKPATALWLGVTIKLVCTRGSYCGKEQTWVRENRRLLEKSAQRAML
jgi:hypothetical protein